MQRIDPVTGEFIDLYDNIRVENNKIVEVVYTNPKPTEENSRVANIINNNKFSQKAVNDNQNGRNRSYAF